MSFTMDDVMEVLQIVKESKDTELHIDSGDLKLSLFKGDIGDSARGMVSFSGEAAQTQQPETKAAPAVVAEAVTETVEEPETAAASNV
ncbi:MAG: hypothetical protein HN931_10535, partial [Desulfobacterales bacterium]|nr:hypothetical protein [Desulfobacterales bacterium]